MDNIEKTIKDYGRSINEITAPSDMEGHLKTALNRISKPEQRRRSMRLTAVAAALLFIMFFAYSFDALAFYGKHMLGYDQVISGGLKELNRMGKGQEIGKSHTFSDGTMVMLDKILFDENKTVILYTEKANKAISVTSPGYRTVEIGLKGIMGLYRSHSGTGVSDEAENQISWAWSFDKPKALDKWMSFIISKNINGRIEIAKIRFTLDRDKAILNVVSQDFNQSITLNGKQIDFKNINVTAMSTVIKAAAKGLKYDEHIKFNLMVDGNMVQYLGGHRSGNKAEWEFEGISKAQSIEITDIKIIREQISDFTADISEDTKNLELGSTNELFRINKVYIENGNTFIEIERDKNANAVFGVFNEYKQLEEITNNDDTYKTNDHKKNNIVETREFKGTGNDLSIRVKAIQTFVSYDKNLKIPLD